jgi:outer membrane protein TolC
MRYLALPIAFVLLSLSCVPAAAQTPPARPATLAELIATADQRNPSIAAARQAIAVAEARVALARSGRGPTVTASGTAATAGGGTSTTTPPFSSSTSISASYVLYDNGQIGHAVRQAEANLKAARLALEAARQDVANGVAQAYVNLLRAERTVGLREQVMAQSRESLRLAEGQFRAGVVPRSDVVRAQAGLAAAEGELLVARNAVDQAKASLNVVLGQAPPSPVAVAPAPAAPGLTIAPAGLPTLIEERSEVRRALAEIEAAEAALALAQAGRGLRMTLDGRGTQAFAPSTQTTYSIGTTISFPLSDAGRVDAQIAEATATLASVRERIQTTRLTLQQQGFVAYLAILDARARIASARAGLAFAQESLRLAQGRYAAGAGPFLEVVDAQTALVTAEVTLARAEFDELAAVLSLRYALGRSLVDGAI